MKTQRLGLRFACAAILTASVLLTGEIPAVTLSLDRVAQRYPWNGLVDIDYTVSLTPGETLSAANDRIEFKVIDRSVEPAVTNRAHTILQGNPPTTEGKHRVTWNANLDGVVFKSANADFEVSLTRYAPKYMVIDVSSGMDSSLYPVSYTDEEPAGGFNTDEYKTQKIVFRLIPAGSYVAGSPVGEPGRSSDREMQHAVSFSKPFYISIFAMTQGQGSNVIGKIGVNYSGDLRPLTNLKYAQIRGDGCSWPASRDVGANSLMGKLYARCKARDAQGQPTLPVGRFDVPTDFQWEYACRAGTVGPYATNEVATTEDVMLAQMRKMGASNVDKYDNGTWPVGSFQPNEWGLYDMHGNVWEWCRDWYAEAPYRLNQLLDPIGPLEDPKSGGQVAQRVIRGGSINNGFKDCRSGARARQGEGAGAGATGFRIVCELP